MCGDITVTTSFAKITCCHAVHLIVALWVYSIWEQLLCSCSRYFGAKRCFLHNNTQSKISRKSRSSAILPQVTCFSHALHVLICICAGPVTLVLFHVENILE